MVDRLNCTRIVPSSLLVWSGLVKLLLICNGSKIWSGNMIPRSFAPSLLHQCGRGRRRPALALTPKLSLPSSSCDGHVQLKVREREIKGERYGTGASSDSEHRVLANPTSLNAPHMSSDRATKSNQIEGRSLVRRLISVRPARISHAHSLGSVRDIQKAMTYGSLHPFIVGHKRQKTSTKRGSAIAPAEVQRT